VFPFSISFSRRRFAIRRAFMAFGLGTALCVGVGVGSSYAISRRWEVYTMQDFSMKLGDFVVQQKDALLAPLVSCN
jgi:hypothetical protein